MRAVVQASPAMPQAIHKYCLVGFFYTAAKIRRLFRRVRIQADLAIGKAQGERDGGGGVERGV